MFVPRGPLASSAASQLQLAAPPYELSFPAPSSNVAVKTFPNETHSESQRVPKTQRITVHSHAAHQSREQHGKTQRRTEASPQRTALQQHVGILKRLYSFFSLSYIRHNNWMGPCYRNAQPSMLRKPVPRRCPHTKVPHTEVPHRELTHRCPTQRYHIDRSHRRVPQRCPTEMSNLQVPHKGPTKSSHTEAPQRTHTQRSHTENSHREPHPRTHTHTHTNTNTHTHTMGGRPQRIFETVSK